MNGPRMKALRRARRDYENDKEGTMPTSSSVPDYESLGWQEKIAYHLNHLGADIEFADPQTGDPRYDEITAEEVLTKIYEVVEDVIETKVNEALYDIQINPVSNKVLSEAMYEVFNENPMPERWVGEGWRRFFLSRADAVLARAQTISLRDAIAEDWLNRHYPFAESLEQAPPGWQAVAEEMANRVFERLGKSA